MIKTVDKISKLLQDEPSDTAYWYYLTGYHQCCSPIAGFIYPGPTCVDELDDIFKGELTESSYWDSDSEYHCTGFYYRGELFLVADEYSDGEDSWNEDEEIANKEVAKLVIGIIVEAVSNYYINLC